MSRPEPIPRPPLTSKQQTLVVQKAKAMAELQGVRKTLADIDRRLVEQGLHQFVTDMPRW